MDGKAQAKVSPSPFQFPDEALLFLEEDMIPSLDLGEVEGDRIDNLATETKCPYWDPRIKGNMISRVDSKIKNPVSRPGRVQLTLVRSCCSEIPCESKSGTESDTCGAAIRSIWTFRIGRSGGALPRKWKDNLHPLHLNPKTHKRRSFRSAEEQSESDH